MLILGVDTGGTFTDLVLITGSGMRVHKVLSTPAAPEQAILAGIRDMDLMPHVSDGSLIVVHGSTVATNAALEGKGAQTLYVCNRGFADVLSIARQNRYELYSLSPSHTLEPVPATHCVEVAARTAADGSALSRLTTSDLQSLDHALNTLKPEAVAINLLFSFLDPSDELTLEAHIGTRAFVARSSAILPEYREYERGMATWISAWLGPVVARYLRALRRALADTPLTIMQSSGGTIDATRAANSAVNLLLSGPAGGLCGALHLGKQIGRDRLLTFDMGGTSTDVALLDGDIGHTSEGQIGPYPIAVPMVDIHTIGAGGGSIARLDAAGVLHVGPESAGADPGPSCYGRGGMLATVTDANLVLGRLPGNALLGGSLRLDTEAARQAVSVIAEGLDVSIEEAALGIIRIANEHMAQALRVISVQRGHGLSGFSLCCFGGAGGLHVCALAEALGMDKALVPINAGVLSALGLAVAPRSRTLSRSVLRPLAVISDDELNGILMSLASEGGADLLAEGVPAEHILRADSVDLRYCGQSFSLNIPWHSREQAETEFSNLHQQRFGHRHHRALELVTVRCTLSAHIHHLTLAPDPYLPTDSTDETAVYGYQHPVPVACRQALVPEQWVKGPMLIIEPTATTFVSEGWSVFRDQLGNLLLDRDSALALEGLPTHPH